jgi:hypothetical protein
MNGADEQFWAGFASRYPESAKALLAEAELVLSGRVKLFGWKVVSVDQARWSAAYDPDFPEEDWPTQFFGDIDFLNVPGRPQRDVKWCWEVNRFFHLLPLAAAWGVTKEPRFSEAARTHVETWIEEVRYPFGAQWSSNLEVGLRTLTWMRCHRALAGSPGWDAAFQELLAASLHQHLRHIERELTVHHTGGNHLLGEASALFLCAHAYPDFRESARWTRKAVRILNGLVPRLILPDGVYAEQSVGYLKFVCEFLLAVLDVERRAPSGISPEVFARTALGLKFVSALTGNPQHVPGIGDADGGSAIGWHLADYWDFSALVASGAVILRDRDLAAAAPSFPAESYLMLGTQGAQEFECMRSGTAREAAGGPTVIDFPHGGYQVARGPRLNLLFDCGPLGMPPAFAHGHEDALSVIVDYLGEPLLCDCGTFVYNGAPVWREFFRSYRAHNTATVVGERAARPSGTFRWLSPRPVTRFAPLRIGRWVIFRGALQWKTALQTRFALFADHAWIAILDRFDGQGPSEVEWNFNFHPSVEVLRRSERAFVLRPREGELSFSALGTQTLGIIELSGETSPPAGWFSRLYGLKEPLTAVRFTALGSSPILGGVVIRETKAENSGPAPAELRYMETRCGLREFAECLSLLRSDPD